MIASFLSLTKTLFSNPVLKSQVHIHVKDGLTEDLYLQIEIHAYTLYILSISIRSSSIVQRSPFQVINSYQISSISYQRQHTLILCCSCSIMQRCPNRRIYPLCLVNDIYMYIQGCGNIELTVGHFNLFLTLLSCYPYTCTLYTVQFQFTGHSLDLSDNVLHGWLFPHPCNYNNQNICYYDNIN